MGMSAGLARIRQLTDPAPLLSAAQRPKKISLNGNFAAPYNYYNPYNLLQPLQPITTLTTFTTY